ncbi:MAG: iron-sulfur cluster assembly protein, partial [Candidatus Rokuibacteriota bacterium]
MTTSAGGVTEGAVLEVLRGIKDPDQGKDVVTLGLVRDLVIDGPLVSLTLAFTNQTPASKVALH